MAPRQSKKKVDTTPAPADHVVGDGNALIASLNDRVAALEKMLLMTREDLQMKQEELGMQAEELESQNEELRSNNRALEEATASLQEREAELAKLAAIVTSSDNAIIGKTLDGTIVSWNAAAERIYGYSAAEAIGRHIDIIVPPGLSGELRVMLEKIGTGQRVDHHETQRVTRDGRLIETSITISPIAGPDGKVIGASTIARDITAAKAAENALKKSQFILAKSQEMARVGNWAWNVQTGKMNGSDETYRLYGYQPQEVDLTENWIRSLVHPDNLAAVDAFFKAVRDDGKKTSIDYRIRRKDGTSHYLTTVADKIVRDQAGQVRWAYGITQDITERKRTEKALQQKMEEIAVQNEEIEVQNEELRTNLGELAEKTRSLHESEERGRARSDELATVLDAVPAAVWIARDPLAARIDQNRLSAEWLRISKDANASRSAPDGERPDTFRTFKDGKEVAVNELPVQLAAAGQDIRDYEFTFVYPDGTQRHMLGNATPLRNKDGSPRGSVAAFIDITRRKRADEELRKSESQMARAQRMAHMGSWEINVRTNEVSGSKEFYGLWELSYDTRIMDLFIDKIHPADRQYNNDRINAAIYDHMPYDVEFRLIRSDGEHIMHSIGETIYDENDQPTVFFGIVQDITERKRAEEERQAMLQRFYNILSNMRAAVLLVTQENRIEYANQALCNYFHLTDSPAGLVGLSASEIIGKIMSAYAHPDEAVSRIKEIVGGQQPVIGEEVAMMDGSTCLRDFVPLSINGEPSGRLWLHFDISERKQAEEELKEAKAQAELYLDLMGHDISNMHQIALSQLELAQEIMQDEGQIAGEEIEMITTPIETLQRSARLIENVSKLQKLRAGEYRMESVDLGKVLAEVVDENCVPGEGAAVRLSCAAGCRVKANPLIKEAFTNLIGNAVKHTHGSPEISIAVSRAAENGTSFYRIAIEDNGPGIPDEKKGEIFHRFKRGQTKAKGTGLGLYIARTLVDNFKGRVWVEDRVPGDYTKGSKFIVYLPVAED